MESIKVRAWECLQENNIETLGTDTSALLKQIGYIVKPYSAASEYLEHLGLANMVIKYNAITITADKIVLFNDSLSHKEKNITLAHELGHIYLGHSSFDGVLGKSNSDTKENEQEKEADAFALELLAPTPVLATLNITSANEISRLTGLSFFDSKSIVPDILNEKSLFFSLPSTKTVEHFSVYIHNFKKAHRKRFIKFFTFIVVACFLTASFMLVYNNRTTINNGSENTEKNYYITSTGSKYHIGTCYYLKNSKIEITLSEALEQSYEPCKVCID